MASTTLQCAPLQLLGGSWEGRCFGAAAISPKCNSHATAVAANLHRTSSVGCEKAFLGAGVRRSLSKSPSFGGFVNSLQQRSGNSPRALPVQSLGVQVAEQIEKLPANVEMLEAYEVEEKVRDYELDHYGVVNNAIYAQFCQHARTELLENIGFSPDAVTETGRAMAISDMSMKFVSPLRSGDRYIVSSRVAGTTAVRLIFEDHIYRLPERELVMSAKSTVVVLDQNAKPGRLPNDIKVKLVKGYLTNCNVNNGNGNATSGQVHGNSRTGELNVLLTGCNSTNGQLNDNLVNDYVNHRSTSKVPALVA